MVLYSYKILGSYTLVYVTLNVVQRIAYNLPFRTT